MSDTFTSAQSASGSVTDSTKSSIYYLHLSDNPRALITSVLLKGDNYTEWATELSNSIHAKQKLGFINGTIEKPTKWTRSFSMVGNQLNFDGLDTHFYRSKDTINGHLRPWRTQVMEKSSTAFLRQKRGSGSSNSRVHQFLSTKRSVRDWILRPTHQIMGRAGQLKNNATMYLWGFRRHRNIECGDQSS